MCQIISFLHFLRGIDGFILIGTFAYGTVHKTLVLYYIAHIRIILCMIIYNKNFKNLVFFQIVFILLNLSLILFLSLFLYFYAIRVVCDSATSIIDYV